MAATATSARTTDAKAVELNPVVQPSIDYLLSTTSYGALRDYAEAVPVRAASQSHKRRHTLSRHATAPIPVITLSRASQSLTDVSVSVPVFPSNPSSKEEFSRPLPQRQRRMSQGMPRLLTRAWKHLAGSLRKPHPGNCAVPEGFVVVASPATPTCPSHRKC